MNKNDVGNRRVFSLLSDYINMMPDAIDEKRVRETVEYCSLDVEDAFRVLMAGALNVYDDRFIMDGWIKKMFRRLDAAEYENDPYMQSVRFENICSSGWELCYSSYKPFEVFVYNDPVREFDGKIIPQIGYFEREYKYPLVKQGGREWMLITPNEIETMKKPIRDAFGKVVTYGLGLGYFAFMASRKENVESVTVVEKDESIIRLFNSYILPFFPNRDKITVLCADAFEYAEENHPCDYVFADIWHDPSDGVSAYLRFKELEVEGVTYSYWIEDTLKLYL